MALQAWTVQSISVDVQLNRYPDRPRLNTALTHSSLSFMEETVGEISMVKAWTLSRDDRMSHFTSVDRWTCGSFPSEMYTCFETIGSCAQHDAMMNDSLPETRPIKVITMSVLDATGLAWMLRPTSTHAYQCLILRFQQATLPISIRRHQWYARRKELGIRTYLGPTPLSIFIQSDRVCVTALEQKGIYYLWAEDAVIG